MSNALPELSPEQKLTCRTAVQLSPVFTPGSISAAVALSIAEEMMRRGIAAGVQRVLAPGRAPADNASRLEHASQRGPRL